MTVRRHESVMSSVMNGKRLHIRPLLGGLLSYDQQVRKQDPNYRKGQLTFQMKKLLQQQVSEARQRIDQKSEIKYLNELLKLDLNDTSVQKRLVNPP
jgi:hypothetical protein